MTIQSTLANGCLGGFCEAKNQRLAGLRLSFQRQVRPELLFFMGVNF